MTQPLTTRSSVRSYEILGVPATTSRTQDASGIDPHSVEPHTQRPDSFHTGGAVRLFANTVATFILVLTAGLCFLSLLPTLAGYQSVVVSSASMEPALHTADVVVTGSPDSNTVQVGTVIDFQTPQGKRIHRVVEVTDAGYRTQGDANTTPDPQLAAKHSVEGIGLLVVPLIGLPRYWIGEGAWLKVLGAALALAASLIVAGFGLGPGNAMSSTATGSRWSRRSVS